MSARMVRVLRPRTYQLLRSAVERGLAFGLNRANKYAPKGRPTREAILEHCEREIMTAIAEDFSFDDDDS